MRPTATLMCPCLTVRAQRPLAARVQTIRRVSVLRYPLASMVPAPARRALLSIARKKRTWPDVLMLKALSGAELRRPGALEQLRAHSAWHGAGRRDAELHLDNERSGHLRGCRLGWARRLGGGCGHRRWVGGGERQRGGVVGAVAIVGGCRDGGLQRIGTRLRLRRRQRDGRARAVGQRAEAADDVRRGVGARALARHRVDVVDAVGQRDREGRAGSAVRACVRDGERGGRSVDRSAQRPRAYRRRWTDPRHW